MQNQAQDVSRTTPAEAGTLRHALNERQCAVASEPSKLKLERYNREFVKIPAGLFEKHPSLNTSLTAGTRRQEIIDAFASFHIGVDIGDVKRGPSFEQYELIPGKAVKIAQIRSCVEDVSLRIRQKVIIGKKTDASVTIEVPLAERQVVPCGFLLEDTRDDALEIPIAVGVDASFSPFSIDLVEMPHLLTAGTTGSGKSIFLKTLIASIMYHLTPNEVRLVLIDPKRVEFGVFSSSLFCACDVITDFEEVAAVFEAIVLEMEKRYTLLEHAGASDIRQYNAGVEPRLRQPYVVVVVDEFADLLMQNVKGFEDRVIRLAQKARASGIHLVLATQRPSVDVIKGLLKANIPGRIAFSVSSQVDSKIILDMGGAENLTGKGDLICICPAFREGIRLQGAYITNEEIQRIIATKS
jgi:S-DNA-T family DNA segregation ATPase FtsK/SpoIIIE